MKNLKLKLSLTLIVAILTLTATALVHAGKDVIPSPSAGFNSLAYAYSTMTLNSARRGSTVRR